MADIHQMRRVTTRTTVRGYALALGWKCAGSGAAAWSRGPPEALADSPKLQVSNQTLQGLLTRVKRGPNRGATLVVACEAAWPGCGRLLLPGPLHLLRATRPPCAPLPRYPRALHPWSLRQPRPASAYQYYGSFTSQHPSYSPSYTRMSSQNLDIDKFYQSLWSEGLNAEMGMKIS